MTFFPFFFTGFLPNLLDAFASAVVAFICYAELVLSPSTCDTVLVVLFDSAVFFVLSLLLVSYYDAYVGGSLVNGFLLINDSKMFALSFYTVYLSLY